MEKGRAYEKRPIKQNSRPKIRAKFINLQSQTSSIETVRTSRHNNNPKFNGSFWLRLDLNLENDKIITKKPKLVCSIDSSSCSLKENS